MLMRKPDPARWTVQLAQLSRQDKGSYVHIVRRPLRAVVAEELGERLVTLGCTDVRHGPVCRMLLNTPDWCWELRWGPKDPEFGIADRSAGHCLHALGQWLMGGCGMHRLEHIVAEIPLTPAQVREHFPEADPLFQEPSDDDIDDCMRWQPDPADEEAVELSARRAAEAGLPLGAVEPDWGQGRMLHGPGAL